MQLAMAVAPSRPSIESDTLTWPPLANAPIEEDFQAIREADLVVFQKKEELIPPFTNRRSSEFELYTRQQAGEMPINVTDDIHIYSMVRDETVIAKFGTDATTSLARERR